MRMFKDWFPAAHSGVLAHWVWPGCAGHLNILAVHLTTRGELYGRQHSPACRRTTWVWRAHARPGGRVHEQGWQLDEDERRKQADSVDTKGGTDYDYGARDFGDEPVNTAGASEDTVKQARTALTERE